MKRLIFATNNNHKLEEARAILGEETQVVSLAEIGCHEDIPETQPDIRGNALQKARYVHEHYGVDCIADDTGLMVDALGGEPGVYSARYAGPGHDSAANMAKLLDKMQGVEDRKAHFSTVLAYVSDDGEHTFEGRVDGTIAETPSGNAGFGYDPVFIADETGLTFADMTADDKNAISHRGRAFRRFAEWFGSLIVILAMMLGTGTAGAEQWRMHPSYDGCTDRVIDTKDYTYILALKQDYIPSNPYGTYKYGQLYRYDKVNDEWKWLDRNDGLAGQIVVAADYDHNGKRLVVGYDDGNIDIIPDKGAIVNIPGLKTGSDLMSSIIKSITVDGTSGEAWVATATGYVRISLRRGEVISSRDFHKDVNAVAQFDGQLFVGTPSGLFTGDLRASSIDDLNRVYGPEAVERLLIISPKALMTVGDNGSRIMGSVTSDGGVYVWNRLSNASEYSVEPGNGGVLVSGKSGLRWYGSDLKPVSLGVPAGMTAPVGGSVDGQNVMVSDGRNGFSRLKASGGTWSLLIDRHFPAVSNVFMSNAMAYSPKYGMVVRNHGPEFGQPAAGLGTLDLICALKDGAWTPLSLHYPEADPKNIYRIAEPWGLVFDPQDEDVVYCGSVMNGLLKYNIADHDKSLRLSRSNDYGVGLPGFVTVAEPPASWTFSCSFSAPVFDTSGTLWTSFNNPDTGRAELWYWTPGDRAASVSSATYRPLGKLLLSNQVKSTNTNIVLPLRSSANKNVILYYSRSEGSFLELRNHNGTPGDSSDDHSVIMQVRTDQDGVEFNCGRWNSMWEDPSTGRVWVTHNTGVFYFNPSDALKGSSYVRRIKVSRNDGTGLADYLLDGVPVNMIAVTPDGVKWFSTIGSGIVVTSSDGSEVLRTYTTDNSELPSDNVYAMAYNPDNKSMMISTDKGLCELFLKNEDVGGGTDIRAYPNPVRPGFLGNVTIDNLPEGVTVKITDSRNGLVKELGVAQGGEIEWNLTNYNNKRVPGGIYNIIVTNGPDRDSFSKMVRVFVVE